MTRKPLATFVLVAYNQEGYIREAVEGAFRQTYQPLEIILSDDCSTDRTFALLEEMVRGYTGPHEVILNRNSRNLGIVGHNNRVFEMATGELVVTAAGDDVSLPSRVENAVQIWLNADRRPDGLIFGWRDRDTGFQWRPPQAGEISIETVIEKGTARIRGASAAWSRRLFEYWGPLPEEGALSEDRIFAFRALLSGGILRDDRTAVLYRQDHKRETLPGHVRLAGKLWNLKRNLEFYKMYETDLRWMMVREPDRKCHLERLLSRLQGRVEDLKTEITLLESGSRLNGLVFAVALLTGRTWTRGSFRARMSRALTVLRRLTIEGRRVRLFDKSDHHGNSRAEDD